MLRELKVLLEMKGLIMELWCGTPGAQPAQEGCAADTGRIQMLRGLKVLQEVEGPMVFGEGCIVASKVPQAAKRPFTFRALTCCTLWQVVPVDLSPSRALVKPLLMETFKNEDAALSVRLPRLQGVHCHACLLCIALGFVVHQLDRPVALTIP